MDSKKRYTIDVKQVSHNDFGDEVVVIHFETGNYYSLRGTAAILWKTLSQGPVSATGLLKAFSSPPETAVSEVIAFLDNLVDRCLLCAEEAIGEESSVSVEPAEVYAKPEFEAFEDLQALLVADVVHDTYEQGWPHVESKKSA